MSQDIFRQKCIELTDERKNAILGIKSVAQHLYDMIQYAGDYETKNINDEYLEISQLKLQESIMWAVKGLTCPDGDD